MIPHETASLADNARVWANPQCGGCYEYDDLVHSLSDQVEALTAVAQRQDGGWRAARSQSVLLWIRTAGEECETERMTPAERDAIDRIRGGQ